jgi:hypothetical protein
VLRYLEVIGNSGFILLVIPVVRLFKCQMRMVTTNATFVSAVTSVPVNGKLILNRKLILNGKLILNRIKFLHSLPVVLFEFSAELCSSCCF